MSEPLLSAKELFKNYPMGKRTVEVLRGVNLMISGGDFLALRGASGAGKSTLLHLLGGLDSPNAGEIWFAGEISRNSPTVNWRISATAKSVSFFRRITCCRNSTRWKTSACPRGWRACRRRQRRPAGASCWRASDCRSALITGPTNFPAANNSASPSRAR